MNISTLEGDRVLISWTVFEPITIYIASYPGLKTAELSCTELEEVLAQ